MLPRWPLAILVSEDPSQGRPYDGNAACMSTESADGLSVMFLSRERTICSNSPGGCAVQTKKGKLGTALLCMTEQQRPVQYLPAACGRGEYDDSVRLPRFRPGGAWRAGNRHIPGGDCCRSSQRLHLPHDCRDLRVPVHGSCVRVYETRGRSQLTPRAAGGLLSPAARHCLHPCTFPCVVSLCFFSETTYTRVYYA